MNIPVDLIVEIFTFGIVSVAAIALINTIMGYLAVRRRLGDEAVETFAGTSPSSVLKSDTIRNPFLTWVQTNALPETGKDRAKLRRDLSLAGIDHPAAPAMFVVLRFTLAIGLPLLYILWQSLQQKPATGLGLIVPALILCGMGLLVPRAILDNRVNARREEFEYQFSDALDLIVICIEAGLGLDSAFIRVGQETAESHPRVAQELARLSQELGAGRSRSDALRAMAERVDVETLNSFVALIIQTEQLGVSIGQTLRVYSAETRERRYLKAEEKAMRIPVLLTIPVVVCFLPVIITAMLLPALIDVVRVIGPALNGTGE
jgi:tight adherence protein C